MIKIAITSFLSAICLYANSIYATFDVEAQKNASVAFSSSGTIADVHVDVGSIVKENEVLAALNSDDVKALLDTYKTTLKYAKKDLDRQKKVKKIIDKEKYDSYAYKYESAKANVVYQQAILNKTILKAPFDGIISSKKVEVGDVVSGQMITTAFTIQSEKMRKLILKFDQKYYQKVKVGDIFKYKVDGDHKEYAGTISKIYPTVDTTSRKTVAEVKAKDIPVGLFGDGYIITQDN